MKEWVKTLILTLVMGVALPWVLFGAAWELRSRYSDAPVIETPPEGTIAPEKAKSLLPVYMEGGKVEQMELEEYLTGVLLCEMPASFAPEAKKAQAVVARTYALRTVAKALKHTPGAVCTDSACCQGYRSVEEYIASGGSAEAVEAAREAVRATSGMVLTYNGELAEATYFSCSGGMTEDAAAVWGAEIPYLKAVESPGEEDASHYSDTLVFSKEQFCYALGADLTGDPKDWFGAMCYTPGGGVDKLTIGGKSYSGTQLRSLLGLRSTAFTITVEKERIRFTTKGFGHRVGMSQYGADAMADRGCSFQEILAHYYPGTVIDKAEVMG